jgi:hypothetical protein
MLRKNVRACFWVSHVGLGFSTNPVLSTVFPTADSGRTARHRATIAGNGRRRGLMGTISPPPCEGISPGAMGKIEPRTKNHEPRTTNLSPPAQWEKSPSRDNLRVVRHPFIPKRVSPSSEGWPLAKLFSLGRLGQHGIGTAKGRQGRLAKEKSLLRGRAAGFFHSRLGGGGFAGGALARGGVEDFFPQAE